MNEYISPALREELMRTFGSIRDFERALERAAALLATAQAKLRLGYENEDKIGTALWLRGEELDYAVLSSRYDAFLTNRPRYPQP